MESTIPNRNVIKTSDGHYDSDGIVAGDMVKYNHLIEVGTHFPYRGGNISCKPHHAFQGELPVIDIESDGALRIEIGGDAKYFAREMLLKKGVDYED